MKKSKEELLAALKAKKKSGSKDLDSKVLSSMGIKPEAMKTKVESPKVNVRKKEDQEPSVTTQIYSINKEVERIAHKIYDNLLSKFNEALTNRGVQIAESVELKEVRYSEKDYIQKIHKLAEQGFTYAFPLVDTNDNYKPIGIMFQRIKKKSVKL